MGASRTTLEPIVVGYQKTFFVRIWHRGKLVDLSSPKSVIAKAEDPAGNNISPTVTIPTQVGEDHGLAKVLLTSTQTTTGTAGRWKLDVYVGDASSAEEPLANLFQFEAHASEVE